MKTFEIKRWDNDKVIYTCEAENIKEVVERAVKEGASLVYANLKDANLKGANLKDANLKDAYLKGADLYGADLYGANLKDANLKDANLYGANLKDANLKDAYLKGADLYGADLYGANLKGANLKDAYLKGADLYGANLKDAINVPYMPLACPSEGSFIGWKKVVVFNCLKYYLIKLEIPEDAKRSSATTNKCRCDKAKVLSITEIGTDTKVDEVVNDSYTPCTYKAGEMVYPDTYDEDRFNECSHGIHFFINKQDAIDY